MLRYCTVCKKDFEFDPKDVSAGRKLICPECGNIIDKNSRHPSDSGNEEMEENIGNIFSDILGIAYIFYVTLAIIGIIGYFTSEKILFISSGIALAAYLIQLFTGTASFALGILFLPAGAIAGYIITGNMRGACLGLCIVFLVRHVIRDIIYDLIIRLMQH